MKNVLGKNLMKNVLGKKGTLEQATRK